MGETNDRDRRAAELMKAYQAGRGAAFDELVGLLGPPLYRFFRHGFRDETVAEDLYQETWMKVHHARQTHRPGEPVMPWLFGIARHVAADHRRRFARNRRKVDAATSVAAVTADQRGADARSTPQDRTVAADLLARAMDGLPDKQAEALFLLKVEGLSVEEAASVAGTTPGALKVRAHRGYEHVRRRVRELTEAS